MLLSAGPRHFVAHVEPNFGRVIYRLSEPLAGSRLCHREMTYGS